MTDRDANERLLRLNAALDGELDAMGSLEFEREMRDDAALAAEYRRLTTLRDAVRRHAPREAAPQALADRIAALTASAPAAPPPQAAAAPTATVVPFRRRAWLDSRALAMAASLAVLGFAVGAGLTSLRAPAGSPDVAQHLVSDFARAEIAGQPFDVASSDRHTVKPWLANRTTVSGTIVDLAPEGFPLVGGRVTIVDRVPTPTLVYRHNEHVVAVTELPLDAKGVRGDRRNRNDRRLPRRPLVGCEPRLCRRFRHGREGARRIRRSVPAWRRSRDRAAPSRDALAGAPSKAESLSELVRSHSTPTFARGLEECSSWRRRSRAPEASFETSRCATLRTRQERGVMAELRKRKLFPRAWNKSPESRSPEQDDRDANVDRRRWRSCRSKSSALRRLLDRRLR